MIKINKNHPRYISLNIREKLVEGVRMGITSQSGLIAHGRGEAFDYLIGEKTHPHATRAIKTAAAYLLLAKNPVISVNGNSAILSGREMVILAGMLNCKIEVNLFHFSLERIKKIENYLKRINPINILDYEKSGKMTIQGIHSARRTVLRKGIGSSDCVFVPLEDGDRCEALVKRGTNVITVDLNPLSRTARKATVTIVDNIVRALSLLINEVSKLKNEDRFQLSEVIRNYDNQKALDEAISKMR